jgi:formylglycine-generating enzyme required for sulfatase activity
MEDVSIPEEIVEVIREDIDGDRVHEAAHAAFVAACWLHGHGSEGETLAHEQVRAAFSRLLELPEIAEAPAGDGEPEQREVAPPEETIDEGVEPSSVGAERVGEQHVSVSRDVNAPIVNAPGGNVYVNDSAGRADRLLHDYLTFLVYVALGVKLPHATDGAREKVEAAMDCLVDYHGITRPGTIGNSSELKREAPRIWETVDAACRVIFGLSFEDSRPRLFEAEFPSWPLFENMVLIRGGSDPYTGTRVEPFYLARFPVTVSQYAEFCRASGYHPVPEWPTMAPPEHLADHPVTGVTLFDTVMFCVWLEAATGFRFRVATESEWCFAATAGARHQYPWGEDYREGYAHTTQEGATGTQPVNGRPEGASAGGVEDLVGNVWELTSTLFDEDPLRVEMNFTFPPLMFALARPEWWETDKRIPRGAGPWVEAARFVMRGGSWGGGPEWATMDQRIWTSAFNRGAYGGFRIACSAEPVGEGFVPTPSYLSPRVTAFADRIQLVRTDGSPALTQIRE